MNSWSLRWKITRLKKVMIIPKNQVYNAAGVFNERGDLLKEIHIKQNI